MVLRKVSSKATVTNDSYTRLVIQSHIKRSMQEQEQSYVLKKKNKESHLKVVSVMMVDLIAETAMAEMERKINFLMKAIEERDHEIITLKDQMKTCKTVESSKTPVVKADNKQDATVHLCVSLSVQQLQDMITSSIRVQYGGPSQTSFMYSKPYTKKINDLQMPVGY
ncbi:ty3-gypsy retrotransposon protein [Cucumis melo var. makuwa]|uniref:Ty3-gypsy retrotransposon protein n=1 Tax=Cucumis melo var. makuwa TaxID=1194695 RepID=A0A5D3D2V3_CUCMM|nr:ty3-gypsy retrotransposon protein [Cucumis melo var. makuwa]TYK18030.1 ty3-gypsy retrotransposon protein [Cucumis melo var. makuwa]